MRTSTLARGGALLTAATLAITLSGGPASAHDSKSSAVSPTPTHTYAKRTGVVAKPHFRITKTTESAVPVIGVVQASSTVLYQPGGSSIAVGVNGDGDPSLIDHIDLNLTVNGMHVGTYTLMTDADGTFINIPNSVGSGKAKITSEKTYYNDGVTAPLTTGVDSNTFYVRRATDSAATGTGSDYALYTVVGRHSINFHANKWVIFKPSTETWVPMQSIKLQYRKQHHWYTLKTIKLNSSGSGTYTKKRGTKYRYRLYYPTTDSILGSYTEATDSF